MPFAQLDPIPDLISLTVRIDSSANPDLAAHIWGLTWGAKNSAVVELLNLGLAAQLGGSPPAVVRPATESPPTKRARKTPARPRLASVLVPAPRLPAAAASADPLLHEKATSPRTAVQFPSALPAVAALAPTLPFPTPAAADPPPPDTDTDPNDAGMSPFLSQFL